MIRVAKVMAHQAGVITLKLIKTENCQACPINCNQPLVDLFAMRQHTFTLSTNHPQYALSDPEALLSQSHLLHQNLRLQIDQSDLLRSSAWLYLVPLMVLLLSVSIGHGLALFWGWPVDFMALVSLLLGVLIWVMFFRTKNRNKPLKFRPKVTILSSVRT
jgi:positive regulator of sigma E activity